MIDLEYLKKLYRAKFVRIMLSLGDVKTFPLQNEHNLDLLADCKQANITATFIKHIGCLDRLCVTASDETDRKHFAIYFKRELDAKRLYSLFNLGDVSYNDFVEFIKDSAIYVSNRMSTFSSTAFIMFYKKGNKVLVNNGSGNKKPRSFEKAWRDTRKALARTEKIENKSRELG